MTRKVRHDRNCPRTIEMQRFKHFQKNKFSSDLEQMPRSNVDLCSDSNDTWQKWKQMFVSCMDKLAPRNLKRISKKRAPWITRGLLFKMHRRDLKKRKQFLRTIMTCGSNLNVLESTNHANNAIKHIKKRYFSDNLEASKGNPRKTWNLVSELSSRNTRKSSDI